MFLHTILKDGRKYHESIQNKLAINRKLLFTVYHAQNCTHAVYMKYFKVALYLFHENIFLEIRTENYADVNCSHFEESSERENPNEMMQLYHKM